MNYWNQEMYIAAWNFASRAHLGQKVPGKDLPYINHVGNVAMEVMSAIARSNAPLDADLAVQCALLHDVIEDTKTEYSDLTELFTREVAEGVLALTKDPRLSSKREKMEDSLTRILRRPREIGMVKMADRITNLQPPPAHWDLSKIEKYHVESTLIHTRLKDTCPFLAERLSRKIDGYRQYFESD